MLKRYSRDIQLLQIVVCACRSPVQCIRNRRRSTRTVVVYYSLGPEYVVVVVLTVYELWLWSCL